MRPLSRRDWLRASAAVPAWSALQALSAFGVAGCGGAGAAAGRPDPGYGPLRPVRSENSGEVLLALPEGFRYTVFGRTGELMSDGRPTPARHDGMAAFEVGGELRLVRNHEVTSLVDEGAVIQPAGPSYDVVAGGGTTTLVIDAGTRLPVRSFASLSGTSYNCAGGPTPWGTWITCEETTRGLDAGFRRPHGYCFEVPAAHDGPAEPAPLTAMGRFVHEAVAVDPETGIVYLTEDRPAGGFYRFVPASPGRLAAGGRLEMLAVRDRPRYDTRRGQRPMVDLAVRWVTIATPEPPDAEANPGAVAAQGFAAGAAVFGRLEGAWFGGGRIYVNATSGGELGKGQVWEYRPAADGGSLRLIFESTDAAELDSPDNICVSPRGRGLVLCEDGDGEQHLRGLTLDGRLFDFCLNLVPRYESAEFAGATFSPDGATLFVNIQTPGLTFGVWGDWLRGPL
jgi:hypothetical protein